MEIFSDFAGWSLAAKFYFGIAVCATVLLVVQMVLMLAGFDHHDGDAAVFDGHDHDLSGFHGITFFSFRSVIAFLCFFGWVGFFCLRTGVWALPAFAAAFVSGTVALVIVALILHLFQRLAVSGNVDLKSAIGEIGTTYLVIPGGKNATGVVTVKAGEALREYSAVSEDGTEIKTGTRVQVIGLLDASTLIVKPVRSASEWLDEGLS